MDKQTELEIRYAKIMGWKVRRHKVNGSTVVEKGTIGFYEMRGIGWRVYEGWGVWNGLFKSLSKAVDNYS